MFAVFIINKLLFGVTEYILDSSELKHPICHSLERQIGQLYSERTTPEASSTCASRIVVNVVYTHAYCKFLAWLKNLSLCTSRLLWRKTHRSRASRKRKHTQKNVPESGGIGWHVHCSTKRKGSICLLVKTDTVFWLCPAGHVSSYNHLLQCQDDSGELCIFLYIIVLSRVISCMVYNSPIICPLANPTDVRPVVLIYYANEYRICVDVSLTWKSGCS